MGSVSPPSRKPCKNDIIRHSKQNLLAHSGFDVFETNVLEIARHFFLAFAEPESEAWIDAFRRAEQAFPVPFGATIANAVLIAIQDMRRSRIRLFTYSNPRCIECSKLITDEERYFMTALQSIRRARFGMAETNCLLLCEGGDATALLASLERIAIITGDVQEPRFNKTAA